MFCKHCGKANPENSKFCQECGKNISSTEILQENSKINTSKKSGKGIWIIATILALFTVGGGFLQLVTSSNSSTSSNPNPVVTPNITPTLKPYNQEEITSTVVNILCPSTVKNEQSTGGSGIISTSDGVVLTNSHIIPQDKKNLHVDETGCLVVLPDPVSGKPKDVYLAHPIVIPELSDKYDLAFMSIYSAYYDKDQKKYAGEYPRQFPTFDDSSRCTNENIKLGEPVRIFGYPAISGGYTLTVTDGIVSSFPGDGLIITSAKISHGNSGGLAVDKNGCMIGIPTQVSSDENESLGIIYSMEIVKKFATEVTDYINKK